MSEDARFEDGEDKALNIGAFDKSDLEIVSSLIKIQFFRPMKSSGFLLQIN